MEYVIVRRRDGITWYLCWESYATVENLNGSMTCDINYAHKFPTQESAEQARIEYHHVAIYLDYYDTEVSRVPERRQYIVQFKVPPYVVDGRPDLLSGIDIQFDIHRKRTDVVFYLAWSESLDRWQYTSDLSEASKFTDPDDAEHFRLYQVEYLGISDDRAEVIPAPEEKEDIIEYTLTEPMIAGRRDLLPNIDKTSPFYATGAFDTEFTSDITKARRFTDPYEARKVSRIQVEDLGLSDGQVKVIPAPTDEPVPIKEIQVESPSLMDYVIYRRFDGTLKHMFRSGLKFTSRKDAELKISEYCSIFPSCDISELEIVPVFRLQQVEYPDDRAKVISTIPAPVGDTVTFVTEDGYETHPVDKDTCTRQRYVIELARHAYESGKDYRAVLLCDAKQYKKQHKAYKIMEKLQKARNWPDAKVVPVLRTVTVEIGTVDE